MTALRTRPLAWLLAAALVAAAVPAAAEDELPALTEATIVDREGALEVWVRLTRPARYQADLIDSPDRLVVDFQDTVYRWSVKPVPVALDPVRALRGSQFRKGVARLVIELRRRVPYTIEQDREGLRIVLPRADSRLRPRSRLARGAALPGAGAPPRPR